MKIPTHDAAARQRGFARALSMAAITGLLLSAYAFLEWTTNEGNHDVSRAIVLDESTEVHRWPGAMDLLAEYHIAEEKMDGLIADGLYDPWNDDVLKVGERAPDFELMPLRFYDFAIDKGITKRNADSLYDPVRLSGFRGNLPVVLIFGSYT